MLVHHCLLRGALLHLSSPPTVYSQWQESLVNVRLNLLLQIIAYPFYMGTIVTRS